MKNPKLWFIVCLFGAFVLGWWVHAEGVKRMWAKRLASDFSLKVEGVEIAKCLIQGKPLFTFISKNPPVNVSWISGLSNANVTGQGFILDADIYPDGSLMRYHLKHGGHDYIDLNGDGDADMRSDDKLSEDSREIRIDGVWRKATRHTVTIDGKTFDVQWKDGWQVKQ